MIASTYYRAFQSHDARFDGRVFVGVTSTGFYCRPICPARIAESRTAASSRRRRRRRKRGSAPACAAGPRRRPISASGAAPEHGEPGLALIADGALDGEDSDCRDAGRAAGRRPAARCALFQRHLGASPIAVAQTRRVLFAKQLLHDTHLPMAEVALASGLGQRAPLQRDLPQPVRPPAQRVAPQGRRRTIPRAKA